MTTSTTSGDKSGRTVTLTTEDMQKKKNDVKSRTTLLLSLPDEHQLRFSKHKTAKELWAAILKTFGGNSRHLRDYNLAPEWLMHTIVWRNRSDLDTISLDDLYNHLKGNDEVNIASVYTASSNVPTASANVATINEDDMEEIDIKWSMALLSMRAEKFWKKTGKKISIQGSDVVGFDKSKVKCFNCHKMGHFAIECKAPRNQEIERRDTYRQGSKAEEQTPKALMAIDGVVWDWIYKANDEEDHALVAEAPTEFALMANTTTKNKGRGCKITEKGTIKTGKLEFKNVYFVKDLRTPAIGFLKPFGCHVMILNTLDNLGTKVDASKDVKKDVSSLRYIVLPNWGHEEHLESTSSQPQGTRNTDVSESSGNSNPTATSTNPPDDQLEPLTVETHIPTSSSPVPTVCFSDSQEPSSATRLILKREPSQKSDNWSCDTLIQTRNKSKEVGEQSFIATIHKKTDLALFQFCLFSCFLSQLEPKKVSDALQDPSWVESMQEELLQFKIQKVWSLVDCPKGIRPIGTKWVLKNKKDERGIVIINKARLVAQGHTQEEGIDYDEVFTLVAIIEAIRLFLAYASFMGFTVYQMDVKSALLYGTIDEEVYVMQPLGFQDPEYLSKVYKVEKAMYGLHQAPRAWYGTLSKYLLSNGFQRGTIDQTLLGERMVLEKM
nr:putative ribonuclease H-like domain-containing protein [Tanacetum cinerariifolium]